MTAEEAEPAGEQPEAVSVVLAADDNYAMPLTVAAKSVVLSLAAGHRLDLYVLDMGISAEKREQIQRSLDAAHVRLRFLDELQGEVEHLPHTLGFISRATYARLFIPDVLPAAVSRVLYLDCDVLARRSVSELLATDFEGCAALGVPDVQSPLVSSPTAVPYWRERGRGADELNFNAGVMAMDLDYWRRERVGERALTYLTDGSHYFCQDQEAINAVLPGRIKLVDPRWNQQSEVFDLKYEVIQPYSLAKIEQYKSDPWIIHYCNVVKPWHYGNAHPFLDEWYQVLDQTAWAGWRPSFGRHMATTTLRGGRRVAGRAARQLGLRRRSGAARRAR